MSKWSGRYSSSGFSIDAKSCFNPICKFAHEYEKEGNQSDDDKCSYYHWKKRITTPLRKNDWNTCDLKRYNYTLGYKSLTEDINDLFENITIGIPRCFLNSVEHQWGNGSDTGTFI